MVYFIHRAAAPHKYMFLIAAKLFVATFFAFLLEIFECGNIGVFVCIVPGLP